MADPTPSYQFNHTDMDLESKRQQCDQGDLSSGNLDKDENKQLKESREKEQNALKKELDNGWRRVASFESEKQRQIKTEQREEIEVLHERHKKELAEHCKEKNLRLRAVRSAEARRWEAFEQTYMEQEITNNTATRARGAEIGQNQDVEDDKAKEGRSRELNLHSGELVRPQRSNHDDSGISEGEASTIQRGVKRENSFDIANTQNESPAFHMLPRRPVLAPNNNLSKRIRLRDEDSSSPLNQDSKINRRPRPILNTSLFHDATTRAGKKLRTRPGGLSPAVLQNEYHSLNVPRTNSTLYIENEVLQDQIPRMTREILSPDLPSRRRKLTESLNENVSQDWYPNRAGLQRPGWTPSSLSSTHASSPQGTSLPLGPGNIAQRLQETFYLKFIHYDKLDGKKSTWRASAASPIFYLLLKGDDFKPSKVPGFSEDLPEWTIGRQNIQKLEYSAGGTLLIVHRCLRGNATSSDKSAVLMVYIEFDSERTLVAFTNHCKISYWNTVLEKKSQEHMVNLFKYHGWSKK